MSQPAQNSDDSHRRRAGETKRARTRQALIQAARRRFEETGWRGTRFEDIAAEAHVSAATAYKHFVSKHELVALAYAPLLEPVWAQASSYLADQTDAMTAIERHLHDLNAAAREHLRLTLPFLEAVWDALVRYGSPPALAADPRMIVPMPAMLKRIVEYGQSRGELNDWPSAEESATYVINGMMLQIAARHDEPEGETARVAFAFARGALARSESR